MSDITSETSTNEEVLDTDVDTDLEDMEVSFDDVEDTDETDDLEPEDTDTEPLDTEEESEEDEQPEEESKDEPEEVADEETKEEDTTSEDIKKHNAEMAARRIAEKQARDNAKLEQQQKYLEEAEDNAFALIYQYLSDMDPYDFQDLVGVLLEVMGYYVSWIAPRGKDGGIDIIAFQDPLGATGRRIKVQVKRQADKVSRGVLSSFLGVLGDDDIGLFICTGGFSPEAMSSSRSEQTRRLTLIDAEGLMKLWHEYYEKIPQSKRSLLPLRTIHYLDRP
jgi:restriction endonuclease Mrr